jgi:hypothetical protein
MVSNFEASSLNPNLKKFAGLGRKPMGDGSFALYEFLQTIRDER